MLVDEQLFVSDELIWRRRRHVVNVVLGLECNNSVLRLQWVMGVETSGEGLKRSSGQGGMKNWRIRRWVEWNCFLSLTLPPNEHTSVCIILHPSPSWERIIVF